MILGVTFVRCDKFRSKRLMLMSVILLVALLNPFYLRNLLEFLGQQYHVAANAPLMEHMAPNVLTLRGWSELIFGATTNRPWAWIFDCLAILLALLTFAGVILLARRQKLIIGTILLPVILIILYLSVRSTHSYYAIAKIILSVLPFVIGLVFVPLSRISGDNQERLLGVLTKLLAAFIVAAGAAGSVRYYSEVLNNAGLLQLSGNLAF